MARDGVVQIEPQVDRLGGPPAGRAADGHRVGAWGGERGAADGEGAGASRRDRIGIEERRCSGRLAGGTQGDRIGEP